MEGFGKKIWAEMEQPLSDTWISDDIEELSDVEALDRAETALAHLRICVAKLSTLIRQHRTKEANRADRR